MERPKLADEEMRELENIHEFNARRGRSGYTLKNRAVPAELNLAGIQLNGAVLQNVELKEVDLSGAKIVGSRLVQVDFVGATLSEATFEDVEFTGCTFQFPVAPKVVFRNCTFRDCSAEEMKTPGAVYENCVFEGFSGKSVQYMDSQLTSTRFERSRLTGCTFYETTLTDVTFADSHVEEATFSGIVGENLSFTGGEVVNTGFEETEYDGIAFEGCNTQGVNFDGLKTTRLSVGPAEKMGLFSFIRSEIEGVVVTGCKDVAELAFTDSKVTNLTIENCGIVRLCLENIDLEGTSSFRSLEVQAWDFSESRIKDLQIAKVKIMALLLLNDAVFENLRLKRVKYDRKLESQADNVQYKDSDTFDVR